MIHNKKIKLTSMIQIFVILASPWMNPSFAHAITPSPTPTTQVTPTPSPTPMGKCEDVCEQYRREKEEVLLSDACPKDPSLQVPNPNPTQTESQILNNGKIYNTQNDCLVALRARWGEAGHHCDAIELYDEGTKFNIATTTLYSASAAACLTACVLSFTPAAAAKAAAEMACGGLGMAASATDIAATIKLSIDGEEYEQWWEKSYGNVSVGLGATGGVIGGAKGTAVGVSVGKKVAKDGLKAGLKAGLKTASESVESTVEHAGKAAAEKISTSVGSKAGSAARQVASKASCGSAVLFTIVSALKGKMIEFNKDKKKEECKKVESMPGIGHGVLLSSFSSISNGISAGGLDGNTLSGSGTGGGLGKAGETKATVGAAGAGSVVAGNQDNFSSGIMGAAMASGPLSGLYRQMPNKDKIPNELLENGTKLSALANNLMSQPTGAAIAAAAGGNLPDALMSTLNEIDELAKAGKIHAEGLGEAYTPSSGGGGGGGSTTSQNPFGFSGLKGAGSLGPATQEVSFEKKRPQLILPDGDIWHSEWNGTIFQIISIKLEKTKERVEQLEWSTPLNRALLGLPKLQEKNQTGIGKFGGKSQ